MYAYEISSDCSAENVTELKSCIPNERSSRTDITRDQIKHQTVYIDGRATTVVRERRTILDRSDEEARELVCLIDARGNVVEAKLYTPPKRQPARYGRTVEEVEINEGTVEIKGVFTTQMVNVVMDCNWQMYPPIPDYVDPRHRLEESINETQESE
ncbi:MAG: hypothetical protein RLO46_19210 [Pseudomonadales bacterium]